MMVAILVRKVIIEVGRTIGKAVLAGVGVELARVASVHLRKRLDPDERAAAQKSAEENDAEMARVREENARLRGELERVKAELSTLQARAPQ